MSRTGIERVVGRATSFEVASAVYEAVVREHPHRLVILRCGSEPIRTSL